MSRHNLCLILLLFPLFAYSQCKAIIDDIKKIEDESVRIEKLTSHIPIFESNCEFSCLARAMQILSIHFHKHSKFDIATIHAKQAFDVRKFLNEKSGMIASILMLYYNYIEVGKIDSAFYYLDQIPLIDDTDEGMINYFEEKAYFSFVNGDFFASRQFDKQSADWARRSGKFSLAFYAQTNYLTSKVENFKMEERSNFETQIDSLNFELEKLKSTLSLYEYQLNLLNLLYLKSIMTIYHQDIGQCNDIVKKLEYVKEVDPNKWAYCYYHLVNNLAQKHPKEARLFYAKLLTYSSRHFELTADFLIETELLEVTLMINENNTIKAKNKLIDIRNKLMKRNEINCDVFLDTKIKIANSNQLNLYKGLYSLAAQIFYDDYESSHDKNILKKSMHYYHMAILLSNQISVHSQREKSALLHQLSSEGLKNEAFSKAVKSHEYDYAFKFSELFHSNYLESILNLNHNSSKLSQSQKAEFVKTSLKMNQLNVDMEYETDPRKAALLNMELGRLKKKKDSLQVTNIEIKLDVNSSNYINDAIQSLSRNEILYEFLTHDSSVYLFKLSKGEFCLDIIKSDFIFKENIKRYTEGISKVSTVTTQSLKEYSNYFYNIIFKDENLRDKRLIIVPNGVIWKIPFEYLQNSNSTKEVNIPLVKYAFINYQFSYEAFSKLQIKESKFSKFYCFAPEFSNSTFDQNTKIEYKALTYNSQESKSVSKLMNGREYVAENATISNFISSSQNAGFLHIASHALIDNLDYENSCVIFSKSNSTYDRMNLHQISALKLDAQQVVLSACESSAGYMDSSEGILSLSRGFILAGSGSVISSLWSVNDQATAIIMQNYYQFIVDGHSKDEALAYAKRKFISDYPELSHPYYWAAFTLTGNIKPIYRGKTFTFWNN